MSCKWMGSDRPRMLAGRHEDGCGEVECRGCAACPERHCQVCGKAHVTVDGRGTDETCAACIGETRDDLARIGAFSARLLGEAISRGINSHAAMLEGPSADPEAFGYRRMSALAGRIDPAWLVDNRDEQHPLWVVGTWEMLVREHLSQPSDERLTLTEAREYLNGHLTRLAHDLGFAFDELARDLRACRGHLEDVLRDGEQVERGAPCLTCKQPVTRTTDDDGVVKFWCERCKRSLTDNEYRLAVRAAHLAHADRLNAEDLADRIRVPASTIRRWANVLRIQRKGQKALEHPPLMRSCGQDGKGRKVYRVADALAIRDAGGDRRRSCTVSIDGAA